MKPGHHTERSALRKITLMCLFGLLKNFKGPGSNFVTGWQGLLTEKHPKPKGQTTVIPDKPPALNRLHQAPSSAPRQAQHRGTPALGTSINSQTQHWLNFCPGGIFKKGNCLGSMFPPRNLNEK